MRCLPFILILLLLSPVLAQETEPMKFSTNELGIVIAVVFGLAAAAGAMGGGRNGWALGFVTFFILMLVSDLSMNEVVAKNGAADKIWNKTGCFDKTSCVCSAYFGITACRTFPAESGCSGFELSEPTDYTLTPVQRYSMPVKCFIGTIFGTGDQPCPFTYDEYRCRTVMEGWDPEAKKFTVGREAAYQGGFMCEPMNPWQCFIIFGVLPMMVLYLFMMDLLSFGFFSPRLRSIIALGVSAVTVFGGNFSDFIIELVKITNMGVGPAFLSTVLILALISTALRFFTAGAKRSAGGKVEAYEFDRGREEVESVAGVGKK